MIGFREIRRGLLGAVAALAVAGPGFAADPGLTDNEIVIGVQAPYDTAEALGVLLGEARDGFKPARINTQFAHVGGGFGGRDHTPFPLYVALAAMFLPDRPVRLAHDRFQQFQGADGMRRDHRLAGGPPLDGAVGHPSAPAEGGLPAAGQRRAGAGLELGGIHVGMVRRATGHFTA